MKWFFVMFLMTGLSQAKEITLHVKGMVCGFCAQGIEKKLKAENGVKSVQMDLNTKSVKMNVADDADISDDRLKLLLKDAGFPIENSDIKRAKEQ